MSDLIGSNWAWMSLALHACLAATASVHAVLTKYDPHSAISWTVFSWVFPVAGPTFYLLLGINRVARKGAEIRERMPRHGRHDARRDSQIRQLWPDAPMSMVGLARVGNRVADRPLMPGNQIVAYHGQTEAVDAMVGAVEAAEQSIVLSTYIFDRDPAGLAMADALARARARGVEMRVLIDGMGALYSWPTIVPVLRRADIPVARFLWSLVPWRIPYLNLRNHRKLLIVDGRVGFTGGANLRTALQGKLGLNDTHFRVEGPVLIQLFNVFREDWEFTTGEPLDDPVWAISNRPVGNAVARGIADGPDHTDRRLATMFLAALTQATRRVRICTPYFLPDPILVSAIRVATLRGIEVEVILPKTNNLPWVAYASMAQMEQIVDTGARVHLCPGPFDHSKLLTVDDFWSMVGSANWDPRSLRLNFEFNVECYNPDFAESLNEIIDRKIEGTEPLTLAWLRGRPPMLKLVHGIARLFMPYL